MARFGAVLVFVGLLVSWQFSAIVGVVFLLAGIAMIGREYVKTEAEPPVFRSYGGDAVSYDISSKPRRH